MSRARGFASAIAMQRAAEQAERARARAERERERQLRQQERERLADEKERQRLFHEHQEDDAELRNRDLAEELDKLLNLLSDVVGVDHRLRFENLKIPVQKPKFDPGKLAQSEAPPDPDKYRPSPLGFFARLMPGARDRYETAMREARARFDGDMASYEERERTRSAALAAATGEYEHKAREIEDAAAKQHDEIDAFKRRYEEGQGEAVRQYCEAVLSGQSYPDGWPQSLRVAYVPESKQFVVEYDLPALDTVPEVSGYKYVRAKREIVAAKRSDAERKRFYLSTIARATLRVVYVLLASDYMKHIDTLIFNGHVHAIDPSTGHKVHPCLVTLRTTRGIFEGLDLAHVDPETCLKGLNASVSKRPAELAPVRPVIEFNMVDPRFVDEEDVLSGLDNRTNLMNLNPREFESLITNLFERMGLETRQTRPSRDGGVDCVAYDPRPIFGGKVVIQAKRYKNTVGVSAVRDLFGTVQNEGASKGILVTTSGYGRSSFEFANGKPLELLDGSNLLYLLAEHAGIEAKIEVPEDWKDPSAAIGE
jgi:restriction system protein